MRRLFVLILVTFITCGIALADCTPTGFSRDGINLTAALINPSNPVSGIVDASKCNIGIYFDHGKGTVQDAEVFGANYFGIVVNGDSNNVAVNISDAYVHDIGENPFNGTQHGVAIYYRALGVGTTAGTITNNRVTAYQKGGIVANGPGTNVAITDNTVTGLGAVDYIAQNGIQVGYGATASVMRNTVSGNAYSGYNNASSGGILVVGGEGYGAALTVNTRIVRNTLTNNDVGIYLSNIDADGNAPLTATNIKVTNNIISNAAFSNKYPYQAGVSDQGNGDKIINNTISGAGYDPDAHAGAFLIDADPSFTNRAKVHANK